MEVAYMAEPLTEIVEKALAETFDAPVASLRHSLGERLASDAEAARSQAAAEAARAARTSTAEALNGAVRRIRQASSITDIGSTLLETAGAWAGRVALLVHKGDRLSGWRAYGFESMAPESDGFAEAWAAFQIGIAEAPALGQAVETREAVISLSVPDHLSPGLVALLGLQPEDKVYLFPLCLRGQVVAVLYADGRGAAEDVQPAALESLCGVAEIAMEAFSTRPQPRARETGPGRLDLSAAVSAQRPAPADWNQMSGEDRDVHLRAQRFARVLVADLQLYRSQEIREGKQDRNLYGRLRDEIDKSREVYQRKFGYTAAGSVDYFHLELLHTLADDQEDLLGPDYPGPSVASAVG
jgi:hypothetical protein